MHYVICERNLQNVLLWSFLYQGQGISCTCIGTLNCNGTIIDVLCAQVQGLSNRQVQFTMALYGKMGFYDGSRWGLICVFGWGVQLPVMSAVGQI